MPPNLRPRRVDRRNGTTGNCLDLRTSKAKTNRFWLCKDCSTGMIRLAS